MTYQSSMDAESEKCATCQYWQGEREIVFFSRTSVRVRFATSGHCTAWKRDKCYGLSCNRYKRWVDLP